MLTRKKLFLTLAGYLLLAISILLLAPFVGGETIRLTTLIQELRTGHWGTAAEIFIYLRLPRVVLGFLVGGSLALVGAVFQVILRNPLATPYTLGVTGGGSLGAVIAISVPGLLAGWGPFNSVQLFSLAGSAATLGLIYLLARQRGGLSMNTLLLAGVTIGILTGALILLVRYLASPQLLVAMDRWLMGGLDITGYRELGSIFPLLLPGLGLLFGQIGAMNHLALGEEMALGHGVDVARVQRWAFIGGGLVTAAAVSLAGPIGFVGLIIPHVVRRLSGLDHRIVLPASFLAGGAFLTACDLLARSLVAPTEMPVGIITAIIGGPFFILLLVGSVKKE